MQYGYCGMLHRPALHHAALQGVGLMNQIRCIVNVSWDIFHPIPYHHSNMLHSDCSRLIGRPHYHVLHRTIHQGVDLINHICHVVNDGEENSFPIMNLRICLMRRTKRRPSHLLRNRRSIPRDSRWSDSLNLNLMYSMTYWTLRSKQVVAQPASDLLKISKFEFIAVLWVTLHGHRVRTYAVGTVI